MSTRISPLSRKGWLCTFRIHVKQAYERACHAALSSASQKKTLSALIFDGQPKTRQAPGSSFELYLARVATSVVTTPGEPTP